MKKQRTTSKLATLTFLFQAQGPQVFVILLGTLIQVLLTVYLPILIGQAIDGVLGGTSSKFWGVLGQMLLVIAINSLVQWWLPLRVNQVVYRSMNQLRQAVYEKLHGLPLSYLDRQSTGDLVARFSSDCEQLTSGLLMIFNQFFQGILLILLTVFTMARLDFLMMIVVVALTPLSLFVARFIARKSYQYYRQQTEARGRQARMMEESISQLSLVQAFNAQSQFEADFATINQTYTTFSLKAIFASSTINPMTRFINAFIYALLAGLGALRIMAGHFTVGELTTFLNYASQYTKPFNDISSVLSELQSALACAERLVGIVKEPSELEQSQLELNAEEVRGQIDFKEVAFSYKPNQELIKDLNLTIPAGAKVAIVGPTGAGKSTLINLLMRFYEVDQGDIHLDGQSIRQYSREDLRRQVGMVLQDTWIKAGSIHENIAYAYPNATRELVIEAAQTANADFFIRQLPQGYDTYLTDGGAELSQGQRQLLVIARVFVKLPKILILDEATSSIDTRTEILVQEAFAKLMQGRTSFIIAHRLSTIQSADLILVMVDGKVVEKGSHKELMQAEGVYYRMQASQEAS